MGHASGVGVPHNTVPRQVVLGAAKGDMVLRAVWLVALMFKIVAPEPPAWPVSVLVVAPMGWWSKIWGGVPKSCPRIPTLYTTATYQVSRKSIGHLGHMTWIKHINFFAPLPEGCI